MLQQLLFSFSSYGSRGLIAMGAMCAFGIASCKDNGAERWGENQASAPQQQSAAAEAQPQIHEDAAQRELLEYMIFNIGKHAGEQVANPAWTIEVRDMRNKLEEYYNTLEARGGDLQLRIRLGLLLADITRSMQVYDKALHYYSEALAHWETLPETERESVEGRRMRSAIANGMGACYLVQGKAVEALPFYEKALEIDSAIFNELAPESGAPLPLGDALTPDLERAAEDVLSSYRCLGDCQRWAEDPEEARDTYKKGQDLAVSMNNLRPGASLQFIRLRSAQGDLENSCGQLRGAFVAWRHAIQLAQELIKLNPPPAVRLQASQAARKLNDSLKAISPKLQEELEAANATGEAPMPQE